MAGGVEEAILLVHELLLALDPLIFDAFRQIIALLGFVHPRLGQPLVDDEERTSLALGLLRLPQRGLEQRAKRRVAGLLEDQVPQARLGQGPDLVHLLHRHGKEIDEHSARQHELPAGLLEPAFLREAGDFVRHVVDQHLESRWPRGNCRAAPILLDALVLGVVHLGVVPAVLAAVLHVVFGILPGLPMPRVLVVAVVVRHGGHVGERERDLVLAPGTKRLEVALHQTAPLGQVFAAHLHTVLLEGSRRLRQHVRLIRVEDVVADQVPEMRSPVGDEQARAVHRGECEFNGLVLHGDQVPPRNLQRIPDEVVVVLGVLLVAGDVNEHRHDLAEHGDQLHQCVLLFPRVAHVGVAAAGLLGAGHALQVQEHKLFLFP
mmetsp:Transcript_121138/g.348015  ORF Transcript_121138/g.348015 Transcript_121138/m.348015 type:complete len:376 (-) Transcript_121138:582-1709(-)